MKKRTYILNSLIIFLGFEICWNILNEFTKFKLDLSNLISMVFFSLMWVILFSEEPIKSLLSLITCFFFSMGLIFYYCSLFFLPLIILILYVGAIAVLFLFVVMLFNHPQQQINSLTIPKKIILITLVFLFTSIFYFRINYIYFFFESNSNVKYEIFNYLDINLISEWLYDTHSFQFLIITLILLSILFAIALICRSTSPLLLAGSLPIKPENDTHMNWYNSILKLSQVWPLHQWIFTIIAMFSIYYILFLVWNRFVKFCKSNFGINLYILNIKARIFLLFFDLLFNLIVDVCIFYYMPGGILEELVYKCPISLSPFILFGEVIFIIIYNIYLRIKII